MTNNKEAMNPPTEATTTYTDVAFAKESQKRHKSIKTELQKIDSSFEKIAFNLHWFHSRKAYEQLGYKTFDAFASKEYNIGKSTAYNFIGVVDRFAQRDADGNVIEKIRDEFKDFQSSKLIALLDIPFDEQLEEFTADMSVRDIKKKVKEMKEDDSSTDTTDSEETDNSNDDSVIDTTAEEIHRQEIISFPTLEAYNKYLDSMNDLIEKNLKSKAFKDGRHRIEISIVWTEEDVNPFL